MINITPKLSKPLRIKERINRLINLAFTRSIRDGLLLTFYLKWNITPFEICNIKISEIQIQGNNIHINNHKRFGLPVDLINLFSTIIKHRFNGFLFEIDGSQISPENIDQIYNFYQNAQIPPYFYEFFEIIKSIESKTFSYIYTLKIKQIKTLFNEKYHIDITQYEIQELITCLSKNRNLPICNFKVGSYIISNSQFPQNLSIGRVFNN
jgi:hypothetical protein